MKNLIPPFNQQEKKMSKRRYHPKYIQQVKDRLVRFDAMLAGDKSHGPVPPRETILALRRRNQDILDSATGEEDECK